MKNALCPPKSESKLQVAAQGGDHREGAGNPLKFPRKFPKPNIEIHIFKEEGNKQALILCGTLLIVWTWLLKVFPWQQPLETDVVRVAIDRGFVGAGLDLLRFLRAERIGSTVSDVHLQLQQDLQRVLELHLTVRTKIRGRNRLIEQL